MPGVPRFSLEVTEGAGGRTAIAVAGEVDLATSRELEATLRERLAAGPVLLDLRQVAFMDSTGIRLLSALLKDCAAHGWELGVCDELQPGVRQVLELTGMLALLPLEPCGPA